MSLYRRCTLGDSLTPGRFTEIIVQALAGFEA